MTYSATNRICAIDIGSNAIRMTLAEVHHPKSRRSTQGDILRRGPSLHILKKLRASVRLGSQVFLDGSIAEKDIKEAALAFGDFRSVMDAFGCHQVRAVATSATRDAKNKKQLLEAIYKSSQISVEVIDGIEEAHLIYLAVKSRCQLKGKRTVLVDIGGGSVEVSFSNSGHLTSTQSFPLGTVRLLDQLKKLGLKEEQAGLLISHQLNALSNHIQVQIELTPIDFAVGTGGNLEYLLDLKSKLLGKKKSSYFTHAELLRILDALRKISIEDRVKILDMKKDRADVVVIAGRVLQTILQLTEVSRIYAPRVGLREGLLWSMAHSLPSKMNPL